MFITKLNVSKEIDKALAGVANAKQIANIILFILYIPHIRVKSKKKPLMNLTISSIYFLGYHR